MYFILLPFAITFHPALSVVAAIFLLLLRQVLLVVEDQMVKDFEVASLEHLVDPLVQGSLHLAALAVHLVVPY
jgi:hypothetical protein